MSPIASCKWLLCSEKPSGQGVFSVLQVSNLMAAESPVFGQFRHIPSSAEPHPLPVASSSTDPLQGLVHEMALSAVIQKHGSTVPSSCHSPHPPPSHNGTIIKNYVMPSVSSEQQGVASYPSLTPHAAGVMLGGSQPGFITFSNAQATSMSLLTHPQASPVLQGTPITVPQLAGQLHEVSGCYDGMQNVQPSPIVERSAMMQPNLVG